MRAPQNDRSIETTDDGNDELMCPDCNLNYLHHTTVHIMAREAGEDGAGTITTVDEYGVAATRAALESELPGRRNSLQIHFWCENCGKSAPAKILQFEQHKGNTIATWIHPSI